MPQIIEVPGHGNVEFPDGMSNEEILGAVQKISPPQAQNPLQSGYNALGTAGQKAGEFLHGLANPQQPYITDLSGGRYAANPGPSKEEFGDVGKFLAQEGPTTAAAAGLTGGLGALAKGGAKLAEAGPLLTGALTKGAQFAGNLLGGAGQAAATGSDPSTGAAIAGGLHLGAEGLAGVRALAGKLAAGRAAQKTFQAKQEFDKQFHAALTAMDDKEALKLHQEYVAAKAEHAKQAAGEIVDNIAAKVPTLKGLPRDEQGLADIVAGGSQAKVSEMYDKSLKDVVSRGQGKMVSLDVDDARKLGFKNMRTHRVAPSGRGIEPNETVEVDAGELASRLPGFWKKDAKIYRRGVEALDSAGVGDPAARAEYSAFQGAAQFLDAAKAMKGGKFNPDAIESALHDLKKVNILRKRGLGDVSSGMMQPARSGPLAPRKPEARPMPPEPVRGFNESPVAAPAIGGTLGGLLGYLGGSAMGHPYLGSHVGAGMGATAGKILAPQGLPTAQLDPRLAQSLTSLPGLLSALVRQPLQQGGQP
jgi:hypothetical protein